MFYVLYVAPMLAHTLNSLGGVFSKALYILTRYDIAKWVSSFSMSCSICSHYEETVTHALLECLMVVLILEGSGLDNNLSMNRFHSKKDCFGHAMKFLDNDQLVIFIAILWEVWNARNRFLSGTPDYSWSILSKQAIVFINIFIPVFVPS